MDTNGHECELVSIRVHSWLKLFSSCLRAFVAIILLSACTTNPATGERQFTALMSPSQEEEVGAQEHAKIMRTYGAPSESDSRQLYIEYIGRKLAANTERPEVTYKFFLLDTPAINAFALPGGYVYVTRGLMEAANDEAELAGVIAHEIGHITARHSAERYSHGVLTSLGALAIATAASSPQMANAMGAGTDLYTRAYSRGQESEADALGIRYLAKAGYDPAAMARFLETLGRIDELENRAAGRPAGEDGASGYLATHPATADRVSQARAEAQKYTGGANLAYRDDFLKHVDGMVYGDSESQGFARGRSYYHPGIGIVFDAPQGYAIDNQPAQVVIKSPDSKIIAIFDSAGNPEHLSPADYVLKSWMKNDPAVKTVSPLDMRGHAAATASFPGNINGAPVTIRILSIAWSPERFFRFQIAIPRDAAAARLDDLKRMTYSLRDLTPEEKASIKPNRVEIVTANPSDSDATLSARMAQPAMKDDWFRALNEMKPEDKVQAGGKYKIITE
jgi:predicted Zn-dependent protease